MNGEPKTSKTIQPETTQAPSIVIVDEAADITPADWAKWTRPPPADLHEAAAVLMDRVRWRREYERDAGCPPAMKAATARMERVAAWINLEAASHE
jgi:hypothetical protein